MDKIPSNSLLTPQRGIEKLWQSTHDRIFWAWEKSAETIKRINKKMQVVNVAYGLAKLKFEWKFRNITKEWYFEHLRETAYILIQSWIAENVSIYQVVVALLHDVLEDTNMTYEWLVLALSDNNSTEFAERVAMWIQWLTKKDWHDFVVSPQEKEFITWYEKHKNDHKKEDGLFERNNISNNDTKRYDSIKSEAKSLRDEEYLEQLKQLDDETLEVKFSDRLHNLRTQWDPNNKAQVVKKIKETKLFYFPLAKGRNVTAFNLLNKEVKKLERQLWYSVETDTQITLTREWVEKVINPWRI